MFNSFCFYLNRLHLMALAALLRWLGFFALPKCEKSYSDGSIVPGYEGWIEVPALGVVAFRRDDKTLQFRW